MSKETRNRRFQRKSGDDAQFTPRSRGMKGPKASDQPKKAYKSRGHGAVSEPRSPKNRPQSGKKSTSHTSARAGGAPWIWGRHAVSAVLANPKRTVHEIIITQSTAQTLTLPSGGPKPKILNSQDFRQYLPPQASHQGVALRAAPLEWPALGEFIHTPHENDLFLVLDQITDPHNVGAMLRLASAFGIKALIMQTRNAPPLGGALAKVAVGCLETVPICLQTNIARTLDQLKSANIMVTGLAGETELTLDKALSRNGEPYGGPRAIVMGAEGPGLRPAVRNACDQLARIPMESTGQDGTAESLNVATAAAIALYEARRH